MQSILANFWQSHNKHEAWWWFKIKIKPEPNANVSLPLDEVLGEFCLNWLELILLYYLLVVGVVSSEDARQTTMTMTMKNPVGITLRRLRVSAINWKKESIDAGSTATAIIMVRLKGRGERKKSGIIILPKEQSLYQMWSSSKELYLLYYVPLIWQPLMPFISKSKSKKRLKSNS
jgi:hypothetical protein